MLELNHATHGQSVDTLGSSLHFAWKRRFCEPNPNTTVREHSNKISKALMTNEVSVSFPVLCDGNIAGKDRVMTKRWEEFSKVDL